MAEKSKTKIKGSFEEVTVPELDTLVKQYSNGSIWSPKSDAILKKYIHILRMEDLVNYFGCGEKLIRRRMHELGIEKKRTVFKKVIL